MCGGCAEKDCQVLNSAPRLCKSLSTDSHGLLIRLQNNNQLGGVQDEQNARASVGGRKQRNRLYVRKHLHFKCHLAAIPSLHYYTTTQSIQIWLPDMHNAGDVDVFSDNKELQLNRTMHYSHKAIIAILSATHSRYISEMSICQDSNRRLGFPTTPPPFKAIL